MEKNENVEWGDQWQRATSYYITTNES